MNLHDPSAEPVRQAPKSMTGEDLVAALSMARRMKYRNSNIKAGRLPTREEEDIFIRAAFEVILEQLADNNSDVRQYLNRQLELSSQNNG